MRNRRDLLVYAAVFFLGAGCLLLSDKPAFATMSAPSPYRVYLFDGAANPQTAILPYHTSGTIGFGSNIGSVNLLTGQIASSSLVSPGPAVSVSGWNTWTFHAAPGVIGDSLPTATLQMTGTFNYGPQAGPYTSSGIAMLCQGYAIGGCGSGLGGVGNGRSFPQLAVPTMAGAILSRWIIASLS